MSTSISTQTVVEMTMMEVADRLNAVAPILKQYPADALKPCTYALSKNYNALADVVEHELKRKHLEAIAKNAKRDENGSIIRNPQPPHDYVLDDAGNAALDIAYAAILQEKVDVKIHQVTEEVFDKVQINLIHKAPLYDWMIIPSHSSISVSPSNFPQLSISEPKPIEQDAQEVSGLLNNGE